MWKQVLFPLLASVILPKATTAQGGAESLAFPGYLPGEYVKAPKPIGDGQPNDVYQHLTLRRPELTSEEIVIYPHHFGFEYGQDPEHSIYEVHNAKELVAAHAKKHSKKHDKHGKHGKHEHHHHHHHDDDHHHHDDDHHHHHHEEEDHHEHQSTETQSSYAAPPAPQPQQQEFRPRPAYSNQAKSVGNIHPHFG